MNIEQALLNLADRVLDFDEASLVQLQEQYLRKVSEFAPTRDWERSMVVYFMINAIRVKNKIFNEKVKATQSSDDSKRLKKLLKVVK